MSSFGQGLGTVIGSSMGADALQNGSNQVTNAVTGFSNASGQYNGFGQSFLTPAANAIETQSQVAGNQSYDDFMKNYTNTPAAQYQLQQADQVQNNSAAAKGSLLSGANERALGTINNGIVSQNANTAYNEYLAGNQQNFGQLEASLGNMFNAIGVGQTQNGQLAGVTGADIGAQSSLAQAQAKNDQAKGSGLGSMFSGLGSFAAAF
jgi:hypothetical protein